MNPGRPPHAPLTCGQKHIVHPRRSRDVPPAATRRARVARALAAAPRRRIRQAEAGGFAICRYRVKGNPEIAGAKRGRYKGDRGHHAWRGGRGPEIGGGGGEGQSVRCVLVCRSWHCMRVAAQCALWNGVVCCKAQALAFDCLRSCCWCCWRTMPLVATWVLLVLLLLLLLLAHGLLLSHGLPRCSYCVIMCQAISYHNQLLQHEARISCPALSPT